MGVYGRLAGLVPEWTCLLGRAPKHTCDASRRGTSGLLDGIADGAQAYFVHGYAADEDDNTIASSDHGARFAAVVQNGHIAGAQFHPERSGPVGLKLLANFLGLAA